MSLFKSWLPHRPLRTNYELPLWNQDLSTSVVPPPPIAQSVRRPTHRRDSGTSNTELEQASDELLIIRKREEELQQTIQGLLDAQAEGLLAGLGDAPEDMLSTGSTTPTMSSVRTRSLSPAQPLSPHLQTPLAPAPRPGLGLRTARRAIWRSILDCAELKEEEDRLVMQELLENKRVLKKIRGWESKREGLHGAIERVEQEDTEARLRSLQEEASHLQSEITDLEIRLAKTKAKHRNLLAEISDLENNVQSELASYKSSLQLLDSDVQSFLSRPPVRSVQSSSSQSTFTSLPPKRRTLEMAKEHWEGSSKTLERQRRHLRKEYAALEEGAVVWKDVVADIVTFERELRSEMHRTTTLDWQQAQGDLKTTLRGMVELIGSVEARLQTADSKGWKLLVVCIGAELEALRQGRHILEKALGIGDASNGDLEGEGEDDRELVLDEETGSHTAAPIPRLYDTEDDDPDPDLILSKQDTDTE